MEFKIQSRNKWNRKPEKSQERRGHQYKDSGQRVETRNVEFRFKTELRGLFPKQVGWWGKNLNDDPCDIMNSHYIYILWIKGHLQTYFVQSTEEKGMPG